MQFARKSAVWLALGAFLAAGIFLPTIGALARVPELNENIWPEPPQNDVTACTREAHRTGAASSLAVEVRDGFGLYRGDQVVLLSDGSGLPLLTLACDGPSDEFRLLPGSYRVQAFVGDVRSTEIAVNVPPEGARVTLTLQRAPNMTVNSSNVD